MFLPDKGFLCSPANPTFCKYGVTALFPTLLDATMDALLPNRPVHRQQFHPLPQQSETACDIKAKSSATMSGSSQFSE
jgi:hypothetical protein